MSILYILIPLSIILMAGATWAFLWAVDAGQFDDLEEASKAALEEDSSPSP